MKKCVCGQHLPVHLAEIGLQSHTCSCERAYRVEDGKFIEDGTRPNPFARYDAEQTLKKKLRKKKS